ncbi:MAG: hypothetical protein LBT02_04340 [Rickettsiales bacterium]|jgi:hypothetical protein|nr:hypothetical protein [Rickettsiales bacterium]
MKEKLAKFYEKIGGKWALMFFIFIFMLWYNWDFLSENVFDYVINPIKDIFSLI